MNISRVKYQGVIEEITFQPDNRWLLRFSKETGLLPIYLRLPAEQYPLHLVPGPFTLILEQIQCPNTPSTTTSPEPDPKDSGSDSMSANGASPDTGSASSPAENHTAWVEPEP